MDRTQSHKSYGHSACELLHMHLFLPETIIFVEVG